METIIDTRQFPKEMEESSYPPQNEEKGKSFPFLWLLFFLIVLFGAYFFFMKNQSRENESFIKDIEKQNEFIKDMTAGKSNIPRETYTRGVSHLFGE